jgi:hypothetical protein
LQQGAPGLTTDHAGYHSDSVHKAAAIRER